MYSQPERSLAPRAVAELFLVRRRNHVMKRLLLLLFSALCAGHCCDAGVTINYEGSAKNNRAIDAILSEATSFGKGRGWRVEPVAKDKVELERVIDERTAKYAGALRGIILYPNDMCEPVHIEFGSDMFMQDFVKTQFAGADIHVSVIDLLRRLKPYFTSLKVDDEGEYWETSDKLKLEKHIATVNRMLDDIKREKPSARGPVKLKDGRIADVIQ